MTWQEFYTNTGIEQLIKWFLDLATNIVDKLNDFPKLFGKIPVAAMNTILSIVNGFKNFLLVILSSWQKNLQKMNDAAKKAAEERNKDELNKNKEKNEQIEQQNEESRKRDLDNAEAANAEQAVQQAEHQAGRLERAGAKIKDKLGWLQDHKGISATIGAIGSGLQMLGMSASQANPALGSFISIIGTLGSALSTGLMSSGPGGWILAGISAIIGVVSIIEANMESSAEKLERLQKEAEDAKNAMLQSKNEVKSLDSAIKKLEELSNKRFESNEAYQEWIDYNNEVVEQYPELLGYIEGEGNTIANLATAYDLLSQAKQDYLDKTREQVEAEEEARAQAIEMAENDLTDRGFDPNDAFKTVDLFGLNQGMVGNNFGNYLDTYIRQVQHSSSSNAGINQITTEQLGKIQDNSNLLGSMIGTNGLVGIPVETVMQQLADYFAPILDENGKVAIDQINQVQSEFIAARQWMDDLAKSDNTLYKLLGGDAAKDALNAIIDSLEEDYATLGAYKASISQSITEGRASLRGFFTTNFYDDNRDWNNALMPLTDLMVAQVSDDELLKPEYFASGKATRDSAIIYDQTEDWYNTLEEGFVETYYQHLDLYSWDDIVEKAGLDNTNLTKGQQQILDALYQKWLIASGYDEEFIKSNEDNLKSFSSQMEKYVSRAKALNDSVFKRDRREGVILNRVLWDVQQLPIDTQKAVESILASGDLQSIVGVVDVMQKLQEQNLMSPGLQYDLNELTKKLNVNLSLEWDNLTELMTQGIDDYEKDVAEATKGLNLADARTWSNRLEQDFDELFYVDDDKYYFKDLDNLQQFYNDKFNPYEQALNSVQNQIASSDRLISAAFVQNDKESIKKSDFYKSYQILMDDYLSSVDEYSEETFRAWIESRDDEFKRTQAHFNEIALHRENESWASSKTSEYNNDLKNIHLSFLQSAQKATVDDLAKLYNLTSEQITDDLIANNGWFKLAGTNDYAMTYEAMLGQAEQAGEENNAAAQDLLHNALKTMLETASKGIDGTLSEQDYANLVQQYDPLKGLNVVHTATGVQFTKLDQAYWILRDMVPYSEELTKFMEQAFKNVSTAALSREYRELQKILKVEGSLNQAQQDRKRTLEEILRLRAQEASSFDFMNRDLGDRNNPATYFDSLYKAMSAINESAESGTMSWDNWSRIWLQIQDSIMEGADIGMTAADVAQVMNEGLGALVDVGGTLSVDLAQIGLDMFNGSESMTDGMKKALENVAKSQIEIIDVQIKQLEAVAALEELDLDGGITETEDAAKVITARSKLTDALSGLGFEGFSTEVDKMELAEVRTILTEIKAIWDECGDDATTALAQIQALFAQKYNWTLQGEIGTDITAQQTITYEPTVELDPEQAAQIEQNEKLTESAKNAATETEALNTTVEKTAKTSEASSKKLDQASRATDRIGDAARAMISPAAQASDEVDILTQSLQNLVTSVSSLIVALKAQFESAANTSTTNNTGGSSGGTGGKYGVRYTRESYAKGTLMGELGPELFVTGGHYYIAGRSGAEFVDLPEDAIVFNHLQTQNLLRKGQSGRGLPVTNERNAVSFARGNVAMASAREAIQKLENAKSMWESLLNMPLSTMGKKAGSGGGGGGGKSATAQLHDLERWYNLLRQIENTEKHITLEQNKRANMQNGYDYAKSLEQELKILQDQKRAYSELVGLQKSYYDERRKDLAASEYGKIFTYTEHGLQQEIMGENMGFDILAKLNATDVNGAPIGHAVDSKAQIAYLQSIGFDVNKLKINDDGMAAEDTDAQMQNFWNRVEGWRSEMDELYDAYHDGLVSWEKNIEEQNKILQEFIDNQLNVEDKLLKAIDERQQKLIDDLEDEHEKFADANQKYIEGLNKALEREQRMYEDSENDKELTQLQRRLAILVRSGGSAADIKSLQDEIDGKLKDNYFDQMQKQIEAVQEASDNQLEKLQTQIDLMTEQLEFQKENGMLWEEVYEMMNNWSAEEMMAFIERNTKDYLGDSTLKNEQNTAETLKELQIWKQGNELDMQSIQDQLAEGIMVHTAPERTEATGGASSVASSGSSNNGGSGSSGSGAGGSTAKTSGTTAANPEVVKQLQKKLKTYNLYRGAIDGVYGSGTREAVKSLQNVLKMTTQDGLYGAGTKRKAEQHFKGTWPAGIYAAGGINTVTGPAWLDGTPQKPEAVLKADDYKLLKSSIFSNAKYSLKSAITSVNDLVNNLAHAGDGVVGESFTIGNVAINLESGVISSDYDARRAAKTIKDELLSIARKTGNLTK